MSKQLLFATYNAWKIQLFSPVFSAYGFEMLNLANFPDLPPPAPENGATAIENAIVKAQYYHSDKYLWVFGDDAGLEIDALGGEPGVQARRWNGVFPSDVDDQTWLDYLMERLKDVSPGKRTAAFVSGWVLMDPTGCVHTHEVRTPFEIAPDPIRPISPGSPITAVRIGPPDDLSRRQEEISAEWERWGILRLLLDDLAIE